MTNKQIPVTSPAATTNTTIAVSTNNEQSLTCLSDAVMDILNSRVSGGTKKGTVTQMHNLQFGFVQIWMRMYKNGY
jgi:hypothetical protein